MKALGLKAATLGVAATLAASLASAAPETYRIDPGHTYPSFAVDHNGGISKWRGKFNKSSGTITLDKEAQKGSVDVTIETASIDFGHDKMNAHTMSADMLDVEKFPQATYKGNLVKWKDGKPTEVEGTLTLKGVSKPVNLKINSFLCKTNPRTQAEVCGADVEGKFNREDFGIDYGKQGGFLMDVELQIQVEASPAT
jgi:polyisoprenoid-binding protein YceI